MKTISGQRKALRKQTRLDKRKNGVKKLREDSNSNKRVLEIDQDAGRKKIKTTKKVLSNALSTFGNNFGSKSVNAEIEAEDREIARLGKLLGLDSQQGKKERSKIAAKLNKEYGMFEGMGDDFGDFLMDLDDLADSALGKKGTKEMIFAKNNKNSSYEEDEDEVEEHSALQAHIIDDDEQEASDIEEAGDFESDDVGEDGVDNDYDEIVDEDDDDHEDDDKNEDEDGNDNGDDNNKDKMEEESLSDPESGDDFDYDYLQDGSDGSEGNTKARDMYQPTKGEDIYGRNTASSADGKYVPPAKRMMQLDAIDESSDHVKMVRRQMNGLMNRLSDQSKDPILRSIKGLFDSNSVTVVSHVLRDCIMAGCTNSTQMMTSLIPVYASILAALHFVVGIDVGAFVIESLTVNLSKAIRKANDKSSAVKSGVAALIGDKMPGNCLVLLAYFYNLRILHHQLIMDIMEMLANSESSEQIGELEAELLVCIVDHCGAQLRTDDPVGLRSIINSLTTKMMSNSSAHEDGSRIQFLLESLTDLKNNKSRRASSANAEVVKKLRRWLGTVKSTFPIKNGDLCLRVSLLDLLDAEKQGRWWRAGASWLGNQATNSAPEGDQALSKSDDHSSQTTEEQQLLALATKMRFNTSVRKNIFVVIMSSRDVNDAFERLGKLDLKGKQDREIMRVIIECCGQERKYNAFYTELAVLLCDRNHQFKMTLQFCFWDAFKEFYEGTVSSRRCMNLAHFLSHVVCTFHLPLSVIKPIDFTQLSDNLILFLATFFLAIFSNKTSEETFVAVFDRVATTKDYAAVREIVLTFLQTHFISVPDSLDPSKKKLIEKRRLKAIKILNEMQVLDYRKQQVEEE